MFFLQIRDLAGDTFKLGLFRLQFGLFGGKVAGDDIGLGQQVASPALVPGFSLLVGFQDAPGQSHPAVGGNQIDVVLHGLGPVVHHVLIDVIGVEQGRGPEGGKQGLGDLPDQCPGLVAGLDAGQQRRDGLPPFLEQGFHPGAETLKLRMREDGLARFGHRLAQPRIAGALKLEQGAAQPRHFLPVGGKGVDVALGDAAVQVRVDVVQVFRLAAVDVTRQVEVAVVLFTGDFIQRHHAGVTRHVLAAAEGIDDAVDVLLAQAVLGAVLDEAAAGVDHEDTLAGMGVLLVQHQDAGGNAGAVEQIGRQADDALEDAGAHQLLADVGLGIAAEQHAVRQDDGALAGGGLHAADDVQQIGVIALLGRRGAPNKTLMGVIGGDQAGRPFLVRKRRIGDDIIVSPQLLAILELGVDQRIAGHDGGSGEVVQDHVHPRKARRGRVLFLAFQGDRLTRLGGHLEQQRTRAAGWIVSGGRAFGVLRRDADDLGNDTADFGRRVELPLALAGILGEVPHQVFVGIAEQIVVFGPVLPKVQFGLLEDGDQVAQALDLCRVFAQLVGVVEIGEITARQPGVGVDQILDDLGIDLVADVRPALERRHVPERGAGGDDDGRGEVVAVAVFVADVFDEQHEQHVVLVLAGIHAAAQFVARGPDGAVEVGLFDHAATLRG